jgi:hypothetical protein
VSVWAGFRRPKAEEPFSVLDAVNVYSTLVDVLTCPPDETACIISADLFLFPVSLLFDYKVLSSTTDVLKLEYLVSI